MSESKALPPRSPFIGSQPVRQNLGLPGSSPAAGGKPAESTARAETPDSPSASAANASQAAPQGDGAKQRLTTFMSKLETTWQLFNRGTRESDEGAMSSGKAAFLEDSAHATPPSLKEMRAAAGQGQAEYQTSKGPEREAGKSGSGPKESPHADASTSKGATRPSKDGAPQETPGKAAARPAPTPPSSGGEKAASGPRPGAGWQPSGLASSRSFLATAQMAGAQMRHSDAAGRPGSAAQTESLARQPVFSQGLAQVHPRVTSRQVSSQMPVHNAFLDERHGKEAGKASPLRLFWGGEGKPAGKAESPLGGGPRLRFAGTGEGGAPMPQLGNHLSLHSTALTSARTELATRFAGKAIHSLLKKLYDEEDVEELDEEEAVSGLGLILRLGGEFTYEHSTRVLDLALELADEVGIHDKATRKEIKYGAALCDIGEFDLLLQSGDDSEQKSQQLEGFMGGQDMLRAGLLHDIGKVNIPPEILYKPGKLTPEEYDLMKMHPIYGEAIVRPIASLRYLCPTIRGHHERWDGKGYPDGLVGEAIPVAARIISVADVFDALAAERPYKRGMEIQKVRGILAEGRGTHFDPALVDSFLRIIERRYPDEAVGDEGPPDSPEELNEKPG